MAKAGGSSVGFIVGGYNFLSAKLKTLTLKITSITEQSDGIGDNYQAFTPVGKQQAALTQSGGFFDTATAGLHAAMAAGTPTTPQATPRIAVISVMGQSVGAAFYGLQAAFTVTYEVMLEISKLTKANVAYLMAGLVEPGQIVQPLANKTVDWNTKSLGTVVDCTLDPANYSIGITSSSVANPTVITTDVPHTFATGQSILIAAHAGSTPAINAQFEATVISPTTFSIPVNVTVGGTGGTIVRANSMNGGAGYQAVLPDLTGLTNYVGKLRDSADDTTYGDLVTFVDVTDVTVEAQRAQRVAVAGIIDRYVSHDGNVTGVGSLNVMSGITRVW